MTLLRRFVFRLLSVFRSGAAEAELSREIDAHLRLIEERLIAEGASPEEARHAARRAFGGQIEQTKERHRDARSFRWIGNSWVDVKLGARMLRKYPGLTIVGGLGMAAAVAISTISFAFFYSHLYATLPLDEGDRIVALENWNVEANNEWRQAVHDYAAWRAEMRTMEGVGAFRSVSRNLVVPGGVSEPVQLAEITASGFRIARVPPFLGRHLLDDDERAGAAPVVVIGETVWQSLFASDASVIGRPLRLGNTTHTIVGVMPASFAFPVNHDYWVPLRADPAKYARGQGPAIFIFGRLASGSTAADAQAELTAIGQRTAAAHPETHARLRPQVLPYAYPILDIQDVTLVQVAAMQSIISLLLVVVAVNVCVLVYARTATRQSEIALRTAIGASRARIVAQLFIEALVLSTVSSIVGIGLAKLGLDQAHAIMQLEMARPPYWMDYGLSMPAVIYTAGLAILIAMIIGVIPALRATGRRVQSSLHQLNGSTNLRLGRTWAALIVAQVAIAVAALPIAVGAGWSEVRGGTTKPAFNAEQFLAGSFAMDPEPGADVEAAAYRRELTARFQEVQGDLLGRLEAESWVSDVTVAARPPGADTSRKIEVERSGTVDAATRDVRINSVADDFFAAFGARILVGRPFDTTGQVVVNRTFAERVFGGSAVGQRVRYPAERGGRTTPSRWYDIVGVVSDLHTNPIDPALVAPVLYHRLTTAEAAVSGNVLLRVSGGAPATHIARFRELMSAVDPTVRLNAYPLTRIRGQELVALRLVGAGIILVVAAVLLLSAAGIYAMMSFTVMRRRKEIGIRTALGADARQILRSIFARAGGQLLFGIAVGAAAVVLIDRFSGGELLPRERGLLVPGISIAMLVVGLIASIGPARRGLRVQPTEALRD